MFDIYRVSLWWLKFSDPSEGANDGTGSAPVAVPPVLPRSQEVLPASVVGVLVEDPVAVHDITGVDVAVMETVRHTGAVVHELHHVTVEIWFLIDPQSVRPSVLWDHTHVRLLSTQSTQVIIEVNSSEDHLPLESSGMSGYSYWSPSIAGSQGTPPSSWSTGGPWSWVAHRLWSSRSPPWWSCTGWSTSEGPCSRCCTHNSDLGSSCPRKR